MLTADELLAGSRLAFTVHLPSSLLTPSLNGDVADEDDAEQTVRLRPLTISDLQNINRAAKENDSLVATLMVQRALLEPEMSVAQVAAMHVGLVHFLLEQVNIISGISVRDDDLATAVQAPLAKASFILAQAFGWTPQELNELTLGQVLLHLQMLQDTTV